MRFPLIPLASLLIFHLVTESLLASDLTISGFNQLEYSQIEKTRKELFENWLDVKAFYNDFNLGLRYENHHPSLEDSIWDGIGFRYFEFSKEYLTLTLGNYYEMFGRGIVLRSYENRDIRNDNNIEGAKLSLDWERANLKLLSGQMLGKYGTRGNPLRGMDFSLSPINWASLGGSYVQTEIEDWGKVKLYSGNLSLYFSFIDFYAELGKKENPSGLDDGEAVYLASNLYGERFGLTLEYKDYERFSFVDRDITYNNPPELTRAHQYTLLNRQAWELNPYDEKGWEVQGNYSPKDYLKLLVDFSETHDQKGRIFSSEALFTEAYAEIRYDYQELATVKFVGDRMENKKSFGKPEITGAVMDVTYYLDDKNSISGVIEHLHTSKFQKDLKYYEQLYTLTFSRSPVYSVTIGAERTTQDLEKKRWAYLSFDLTILERHNISLTYGTRRAGKVCASGMCIERPPLEGFELKVLSQF
ncbi:MAG: hypothetical protein AMJ90_08860 [candidate division Zixibacteria bacterium SM23_73_2]|nr:MAG: hypothetical protein AMJ90_08860 [candidate division Zixibacteria bacterium SM23_73_2]